MSDESQFINSAPNRPLRLDEIALVRALLHGVHTAEAIETELTASRVVDMQDGGMRSIRFIGNEPQSFGRVLAEAQYSDSDGVLVSIALNADKHGQLFELDVWKVDFSRLKCYPNPSSLSGISTPQ